MRTVIALALVLGACSNKGPFDQPAAPPDPWPGVDEVPAEAELINAANALEANEEADPNEDKDAAVLAPGETEEAESDAVDEAPTAPPE